MKALGTLFLAAALAAPAAAESMEDLRQKADTNLLEGIGQAAETLKKDAFLPGEWKEPSAVEESAEEPREPVLRRPTFIEIGPQVEVGPLLGAFALAERLDSHSDLYTLQLGAKTYDISLASDPTFDVQYLSFRREDQQILHRIKNVNDLRGKGVNVRLDEATVYNFKVKANIFSPARGSTLKVTPVNGTQGPSHSIKTGNILDAVERESFVFKTGGKEFWLLYGTDIDPATDQPTDTRSFLIIHEEGLSSKAWPIAEGRVEAGKPLVVGLGDTQIALVKTLSEQLRIHEPAR